MLIQPVDYFLVVWAFLAAASTAYVGWDQFRNNPEPIVMKWGFILVTLYMGPLGCSSTCWLIKSRAPASMNSSSGPSGSKGQGRPSTALPAMRQESFLPRS